MGYIDDGGQGGCFLPQSLFELIRFSNAITQTRGVRPPPSSLLTFSIYLFSSAQGSTKGEMQLACLVPRLLRAADRSTRLESRTELTDFPPPKGCPPSCAAAGCVCWFSRAWRGGGAAFPVGIWIFCSSAPVGFAALSLLGKFDATSTTWRMYRYGGASVARLG